MRSVRSRWLAIAAPWGLLVIASYWLGGASVTAQQSPEDRRFGGEAASRDGTTVRTIGSRLELFVDDWLIDRSEGARLVLHKPIPREVVLQLDQPWEKVWEELPEAERKEQIARGVWSGPTPLGFTSVMKDGDLFRLYYTWDRSDQPSLTGYAESRDGIHWTKPALGIVEFRGSKVNNLVWSENKMWAFAPFRDVNPTTKPDERYKALAGGPPEIALVSADGLHWRKLRAEPVLTDGAFDSLNVAFWDSERKQYVAYYRDYYPSGVAAYVAAHLDSIKFNRDLKYPGNRKQTGEGGWEKKKCLRTEGHNL